MDKLKQVLKFQFWILLGVALILPFVGWSMARSGLISDVEVRTKSLTGLNDSLKTTPDDPNKDWETGLETINVEQEKQKKIAAKALYERQLPLMTWPTQMPNDPAKFQTKHQEYYRTAYRQFVENVRKVVKPYDDETQTGLVIYPDDLLPTPDLSEWVSQAPSVEQIRAAQEDLWLLSALLKQIASVNEDENKDARTPFDAAIRQINELYLRGGSSGTGGAKSASSGGGSGGAAEGARRGAEAANAARNAMGGGRGGAGATSITSPKINPDDDLGPEQAAGDAKPGASNTPGGNGPPATSRGSVGRWSPSTVGRYRDNKPEFQTRGFYLEVVMDHRRIPALLAALANADWPVNVLRVQEADFRDEDLADASGGGLPSMGMGASGRPMGGPPPGAGRPPGIGGGGAPPGTRQPSLRTGGRSSDESNDPSANNRSPLDDPNLANVAIVGVIYIFKKPPVDPNATSPTSPAPSAAPGAMPGTATSPVASTPAAGAPGATAPATTPQPAAAQAESETAAEDDAKAERAEPAAAGPKNKPEEGHSPAKEGSPEKTAPEKTAKS